MYLNYPDGDAGPVDDGGLGDDGGPVDDGGSDGDGGLDDYLRIRLARPQDIYNETEQCYPGLAIRKLGYACLGIDPTGGGNPYFIKVSAGDNPPVYQVYHDVSRIGEEIEKRGMYQVADSLAAFFNNAKASDYHGQPGG
jgi:hypothetical protein